MAQIFTKLKPQFENVLFERDDKQMVINFGPQHPLHMGSCV